MSSGKLIFISGGARSGKSTFAEEMMRDIKGPIAYLATAQALDKEMESRINQHRQRRPKDWTTFEEPLQISELIEKHCTSYPSWLLDCVTLYVSNLLFFYLKTHQKEDELCNDGLQDFILHEIKNLLKTVQNTGICLVAVSNEVGWGLVPPDSISRAYRDIMGIVNQLMAQASNEVYLVSMGIPLCLKSRD